MVELLDYRAYLIARAMKRGAPRDLAIRVVDEVDPLLAWEDVFLTGEQWDSLLEQARIELASHVAM